jgi:hypothetical protein
VWTRTSLWFSIAFSCWLLKLSMFSTLFDFKCYLWVRPNYQTWPHLHVTPEKVSIPLFLLVLYTTMLRTFILRQGLDISPRLVWNLLCIPRLALNLWSSCLCLPSAGIRGVYHQAWPKTPFSICCDGQCRSWQSSGPWAVSFSLGAVWFRGKSC